MLIFPRRLQRLHEEDAGGAHGGSGGEPPKNENFEKLAESIKTGFKDFGDSAKKRDEELIKMFKTIINEKGEDEEDQDDFEYIRY